METSAKRVKRALKVFGAFNALFEDLNEGEKKEFMCKLSVNDHYINLPLGPCNPATIKLSVIWQNKLCLKNKLFEQKTFRARKSSCSRNT